MVDVVDSRTQHISDIDFLAFCCLFSKVVVFSSFLVFFAPCVSRICLSVNQSLFFWFV